MRRRVEKVSWVSYSDWFWLVWFLPKAKVPHVIHSHWGLTVTGYSKAFFFFSWNIFGGLKLPGLPRWTWVLLKQHTHRSAVGAHPQLYGLNMNIVFVEHGWPSLLTVDVPHSLFWYLVAAQNNQVSKMTHKVLVKNTDQVVKT